MKLKRRALKLKLRRIARKSQKQVEDISLDVDEQINRHFFRRLGRLFAIRRFLIGWIALMILLGVGVILQFNLMKHQVEKTVFVPGGIFTEGIVGNYTNANPIYATGSVDSAASKLLFSGLFTYDEKGELVPDLAEKLEVDQTETKYTVTLKDNIYWHDGQPLTASDVVFTFNTVKEPDAKSYLLSSWQGISIEAKSPKVIVFTLRDTLSSFPHSLTTGLIPEHVLKDVPFTQLRSNDFNTIRPVGSGPFKLDVVEVDNTTDLEAKQQQIGFLPFDKYYKGKPKLSRYVIKTVKDQTELEKNYRDKKVQAIGGLFPIPDDIKADAKNEEFAVPLSAQVMVFFKTSSGILADTNVRKALVLGSDRKEVIKNIGYPLKINDSPLLISQVGYNKEYAQHTGKANEAKNILEQAGWKADPKTGIRMKDNNPLEFQLTAESNKEYTAVADTLQKQWKEIGVNLIVRLQDPIEVRTAVSSHNYEALLYAISTGADPDVFAYWHSSQADPRSQTRLNLSEYNSAVADEALKAGRSRSDKVVREAKYKPFVEAWRNDNPALALYQPRYTFIVRTPFDGFDAKAIVTPTDRYSYVENWAVRQEKVL